MHVIAQLIPLVVVATIAWLIVARKTGAALPRFSMPAAPRRRPKRARRLKLVKGAAMDRELAKLLHSSEEEHRHPGH